MRGVEEVALVSCSHWGMFPQGKLPRMIETFDGEFMPDPEPLKSKAHPEWPYKGTPWEWKSYTYECVYQTTKLGHLP